MDRKEEGIFIEIRLAVGRGANEISSHVTLCSSHPHFEQQLVSSFRSRGIQSSSVPKRHFSRLVSRTFSRMAVSGAKSNQDFNLSREYRREKKPSNTRYRKVRADPPKEQYGGIIKSVSRRRSVGGITMIIARKKSHHCRKITSHFGNSAAKTEECFSH